MIDDHLVQLQAEITQALDLIGRLRRAGLLDALEEPPEAPVAWALQCARTGHPSAAQAIGRHQASLRCERPTPVWWPMVSARALIVYHGRLRSTIASRPCIVSMADRPDNPPRDIDS